MKLGIVMKVNALVARPIRHDFMWRALLVSGWVRGCGLWLLFHDSRWALMGDAVSTRR